MTETDVYQFEMTCLEPKKMMGSYEAEVEFLLELKNIYTTGAYMVQLEVFSNSDPDNWTPIFVNDTEVDFYGYAGENGTKIVRVVPTGAPPEDSTVEIMVRATCTRMISQFQGLQVTMNSWEPNICTRDRFGEVIAGHSTNYTLNITNCGLNADIFNLTNGTLPSGWSVRFLNHLRNEISDTGVLTSRNEPLGSYTNIIVEVTADSAAQKYDIESITVWATSQNDDTQTTFTILETLVVDTLFCISDVANAGDGRYYSAGDFTGHAVNPGMMTTYMIEVYNTDATIPYTSIDVGIDYIDGTWVADGWTFTLEYPTSGAMIDNDVDTLLVQPGLLDGFGARLIMYLNVTVPPSATEDTVRSIVVHAIPDGGSQQTVELPTRVTNTLKTIWIMYNGVNGVSTDLEYEGDWLWPRLREFMAEGSTYTNNYGIHLVGADPNYFGALCSARTTEHGLLAAGFDYTGRDPSTNEPTGRFFTHDDLEADTVFNTIKAVDPNVRTGVINAKYWLTPIMTDDDVDIVIDGVVHPHYVPPAETYVTGPPGDLPHNQVIPTWLAATQCSTEWVFEAAKHAILYEDVDFLFISNVETDNAAHKWGSEKDTDDSINNADDPAKSAYVMHETDRITGEFFDFLKTRVGSIGTSYDNSIIVVNADHGMTTAYTSEDEQKVDLKEWLANRNILEGHDYEYIQSGGSQAMIYNFTSDALAQQVKNDIINNYRLADDTNPIWKVLNKSEMQTAVSDHPSTEGQPYALLIPSRVARTTDFAQPDLAILPLPRYPHTIYAGGLLTTTTGSPLPYQPIHYGWMSRLPADLANERLLVGTHGTYTEQHVPLVFHGPGIKQGYVNSDFVENLQVVPTLCEIHGWKIGDGYFQDHEGYNPILSCLDLWEPGQTIGSPWWKVSGDGCYYCGDDPVTQDGYDPQTQSTLESPIYTIVDSQCMLLLDFDANYQLESDEARYFWPFRPPPEWVGPWPPYEINYPSFLDGIGIEASQQSALTFETIEFNAVGISGEGQVHWYMGDGTELEGITVTHEYQAADVYVVMAEMVDGGEIYMRNILIEIGNRPPVPVIDIYQQVHVTARMAGKPGDTALIHILEDGVAVATLDLARGKGEPVNVTTWFPNRMEREYTLQVSTDEETGHTVNVIVNLTSENSDTGIDNYREYEASLKQKNGYTATISLDEDLAALLDNNRHVYLDASQSYDMDGTITAYTWEVEEDIYLEGTQVDHTYTRPGNYSVTLWVEDEYGDGANTTTSFQMNSIIASTTYSIWEDLMDPFIIIPYKLKPKPIFYIIPGDNLYAQVRFRFTSGDWSDWENLMKTPGLSLPSSGGWKNFQASADLMWYGEINACQVRFALVANGDGDVGTGVSLNNIEISLL